MAAKFISWFIVNNFYSSQEKVYMPLNVTLFPGQASLLETATKQSLDSPLPYSSSCASSARSYHEIDHHYYKIMNEWMKLNQTKLN